MIGRRKKRRRRPVMESCAQLTVYVRNRLQEYLEGTGAFQLPGKEREKFELQIQQ